MNRPNNNAASSFLQYVQGIPNPQSLMGSPAMNQLQQKYKNKNPQQIAYELAQDRGISQQQLNQIAKQLGIIQ